MDTNDLSREVYGWAQTGDGIRDSYVEAEDIEGFHQLGRNVRQAVESTIIKNY